MPGKFYIQTVGCQMNVLDGELVVADLPAAGYQRVESALRADVVLLLPLRLAMQQGRRTEARFCWKNVNPPLHYFAEHP
jgi:hypothetical protein